MLSKKEAFEQTKAAQLQLIEEAISEAAGNREFETDLLNLTDEEQGVLREAGYKITYTATKQGKVWRINWSDDKPEPVNTESVPNSTQ